MKKLTTSIGSVKWYRDTFKSVEVIEDFVIMNSVDSGLIVIGEELDDNQISGSPYNFDLDIHRHVNIPVSEEVKDFFDLNSIKFITKEK